MKRLILAAAVAATAAVPASAAVTLELFDQGYNAPVYLTGLANNVYVVEQGGQILKVNRSTKARTSFFTVPNIETGGEKGLLGLAFDPSYRTNGRFYVNVTSRVGGQLVSEVRRYTDPAIRQEAASVILRVNQPFDNHNGGWMSFGADKNLYIAFGDGGSSNDPQNNAQNTSSLLGKILRIDVRGDAFPGDPNRNYRIPGSNPFGNEVFAYGLRNPYRASFDGTTGDLWIGDVGQGRYEEVDRIARGTSGQNFGWRPLEGPDRTAGITDPIPPNAVAPTYFYDHDEGDRSITGGYVYRGSRVTELAGRYVFGDFVSGRLWSMALDGTDAMDMSSLFAPFGDVNISSFGVNASRGLYVIDYSGRIFNFDIARNGASAAPEPAGWALMIAGFGLVGTGLRRQRTATA